MGPGCDCGWRGERRWRLLLPSLWPPPGCCEGPALAAGADQGMVRAMRLPAVPSAQMKEERAPVEKLLKNWRPRFWR